MAEHTHRLEREEAEGMGEEEVPLEGEEPEEVNLTLALYRVCSSQKRPLN